MMTILIILILIKLVDIPSMNLNFNINTCTTKVDCDNSKHSTNDSNGTTLDITDGSTTEQNGQSVDETARYFDIDINLTVNHGNSQTSLNAQKMLIMITASIVVMKIKLVQIVIQLCILSVKMVKELDYHQRKISCPIQVTILMQI